MTQARLGVVGGCTELSHGVFLSLWRYGLGMTFICYPLEGIGGHLPLPLASEPARDTCLVGEHPTRPPCQFQYTTQEGVLCSPPSEKEGNNSSHWPWMPAGCQLGNSETVPKNAGLSQLLVPYTYSVFCGFFVLTSVKPQKQKWTNGELSYSAISNIHPWIQKTITKTQRAAYILLGGVFPSKFYNLPLMYLPKFVDFDCSNV